MTSLAELLMRNRLDAVGDKPEYTTADVNALMPAPSWKSPLAGLGSYQLSQEAGAEPNWFGRNVLSNIPPEAMHAANFLIPGKVPRLPNPIKAYHGSPHDFDKFDLSKIGTGEGEQAYGHGLYFAENPRVAQQYRDDLTRESLGNANIYVGGKQLERANRGDYARDLALDDLIASGGDVWRAIERVHGTRGGGKDKNLTDRMVSQIREWEQQGIELRPGRMYEVALHATPEQFLDWDKPLAQQNRDVSQRLRQFADAIGETEYMPGHKTVEDLHRVLERRSARSGSLGLGRALEAAQEAGIPGIRYLDQGSRSAGQGTSNYVVWSPEIIEILRKYGLAPAIAAPALASVLQGDNQ